MAGQEIRQDALVKRLWSASFAVAAGIVPEWQLCKLGCGHLWLRLFRPSPAGLSAKRRPKQEGARDSLSSECRRASFVRARPSACRRAASGVAPLHWSAFERRQREGATSRLRQLAREPTRMSLGRSALLVFGTARSLASVKHRQSASGLSDGRKSASFPNTQTLASRVNTRFWCVHSRPAKRQARPPSSLSPISRWPVAAVEKE